MYLSFFNIQPFHTWIRLVIHPEVEIPISLKLTAILYVLGLYLKNKSYFTFLLGNTNRIKNILKKDVESDFLKFYRFFFKEDNLYWNITIALRIYKIAAIVFQNICNYPITLSVICKLDVGWFIRTKKHNDDSKGEPNLTRRRWFIDWVKEPDC